MSQQSSLRLTPGIYKFDIKDEHQKSRLHLRVDEDLSGLLVVNSARIVYLNRTAMAMAYLYLNHTDQGKAVNTLLDTFKIDKKVLETDYSKTISTIQSLVDENSKACPVCDLGLSNDMPFSTTLSAPYRMDLAITYRCNNDCAHCYNARARNHPELTTQDWKNILENVWKARIPHVVFTGGEPTLRDDLPELVAYADSLGMVTGLNTNGIRFADRDFLDRLVAAGLDHVQITIESHNPTVHDAMVRHKGAWEKHCLV